MLPAAYDYSFRKRYAPHQGGTNVGFVDGHARWMEASEAIKASGSCHCCVCGV